jgi:HK97 family phage major capsid protein
MSDSVNGLSFARVARAMCIAKGQPHAALAFANANNFWGDTKVATLLKSAVTPMSTADVDQATRAVAYDFAQALRPRTIIGRLQGLRAALFLTRSIVATGGASANWVGEGVPTPASAMALTSAVVLGHTKASGLCVLTNELLQSSNPKADEVIAADLARACAQLMDLAFIDPTNAGSADKPAAVTHGCPTVPSTGAALANIDEDLRAIIEKVSDAEQGLISPAWVMHPWTATYLGLMRGSGGTLAYPGIGPRGGVLLGIPVITSTGVQRVGSPSSSYIALVDADDILLADDGEAAVDYSNNTALQVVDNPSNGATSLISMFQTNSTAARVTRWINWHARRTSAAVVLTGITY